MYKIMGIVSGVLFCCCVFLLAGGEDNLRSPWGYVFVRGKAIPRTPWDGVLVGGDPNSRSPWFAKNFYVTYQPVIYEDTCIRIDGNDHRLVDGVDLSGKNFFGMYVYHLDPVEGHPGWTELKDISFSGSRFNQMFFGDLDFIDCNFSGARIIDTYLGDDVHESNFQDAWIENSYVDLRREQLLSTANYKAKRFVGVCTKDNGATIDYSGISFVDFDLRYSTFSNCNLVDCDFTDATIKGISLEDETLRIEQLLVTKDFKQGLVQGITLVVTFPEHVVDFSNMVFVDCQFLMRKHNVAKVDLSNSVISGCDFRYFTGLTLENVKSTWNYKHGRMEGIKLPEEIQKTLDAEKK